MTSIRSLSIIATAIFVLSVSCYASQDDVFEEYVQSFVSQLARSGLELPAFDGAVLDCVETVELWGEAKGTLCWLKNEKGRFGYLLFSGEPDSLALLAFSESGVCCDLLPYMMSTEGGDGAIPNTGAADIAMVSEGYLVATSTVRLGLEHVQLSNASCSIITLFSCVQRTLKQPLFIHGSMVFLDTHGASASSAQLCPEKAGQIAEEYINETSARNGGWRPFAHEQREVLEEAGVDVNSGQTPEEQLRLRTSAREVSRAHLHRRLENPLDAKERYELLKVEMMELRRVAGAYAEHPQAKRYFPSNRMYEALLLQEDYLAPENELIDNLRYFLFTRGLNTVFHVTDADKASGVPALLVEDNEVLGVVVGEVTLGGIEFLCIFVPRTSTPKERDMGEVGRRMAADPSRVRGYSQEEVEAFNRRLIESLDRRVLYEDLAIRWPECLRHDVQVIRKSCLVGVQTLHLDVSRGDNWGATQILKTENRND